jgi:hypothetical protein
MKHATRWAATKVLAKSSTTPYIQRDLDCQMEVLECELHRL